MASKENFEVLSSKFIQYTFNKNKTSLKTLKSINYPINDSQFYKVISSSAIGDSKILFDFEEDDMLNGDGANLEINNLNEIKLEKLKFRVVRTNKIQHLN